MTTANSEPTTKKPYTDAEIEEMVSSVVSLATMTCQQLCDQRTDDLGILHSLGDFPPKQRGAIRAAAIRDLAAVNAQLKRQKCPVCP